MGYNHRFLHQHMFQYHKQIHFLDVIFFLVLCWLNIGSKLIYLLLRFLFHIYNSAALASETAFDFRMTQK